MALLDTLNGPDDLKRIPREQLPELAQEVRDRLIDCVSVTGGHIGASLGVVELTIALLYEFDSPTDKILWDVGHQAYAWKLLTGRNAEFPSLRQTGGHFRLPQALRERTRPVRRRPRRHRHVGGARHGHRRGISGARTTRSWPSWVTAR